MQKLLLRVGSVFFLWLLLYSCKDKPKQENNVIITEKVPIEKAIAFPSCFLRIDTLLPDDNTLEEHFKTIEGYIFDSIPRESKRGFREKKYYFHFDINIDHLLVKKYDIDPYMDYINELTKLLHLPMGTVDGYPIADTYFTYTPLYTKKGDASFIEITVKKKGE